MFWRKPKLQTWEYLVEDGDSARLHKLGREGWELVSAIYRTIGEERQRIVLFFKRRDDRT